MTSIASMRACTLVALAAIVLTLPTSVRADVSGTQWQTSGWPLLETYCVDCHNEDYREAEVDLSLLSTAEGIAANPELATHAVSMIRFGAMPPEDADVPDDATRRLLGDALDELVYQTTCDLRPQPGKITARRLNRVEYNHAIRDIFGVDLRPADKFPSDEVGGGFDNNADVLSVSPMLMDKYLDAAESVASAVVVDPDSLPTQDLTFGGLTLNILGDFRIGRFGEQYLAPESMAFVDVTIDVSGTYEFIVRGSPSWPLNPNTRDDDSPGEDDRKYDTLTAIVDREGTLLGTAKLRYRGVRGRLDSDSFRVHLNKGSHRLFVCPTSTLASKESDDPQRWAEGESGWKDVTRWSKSELKQSIRDPNEPLRPDSGIDMDVYPYKIGRLQIRGPKSSDRGDLPSTQASILRSQPSFRPEAVRERRYFNIVPAARQCLRPIAQRAFRGPVSDDELQPYVNLVVEATKRDDSFIEGLQTAIAGILVSPRFLFRIELPDPELLRAAQANLADADQAPSIDEDDTVAVRLTSRQLASRLSFFLWSSIPDDELRRAAERGELNDPKQRRKQVARMLADPKALSLADHFATQWFGLGGLSARETDVAAESLLGETKALFHHVLTNNLPVAELLTADYSFVDASLAEHYGIESAPSRGDAFQRVSLAGTGRRGLLTHASVLTLTSYPDRNSPVLRGKWILDNVLGTPPPDAPPGVPALDETQDARPDATLREQLEMHRADPGCASCHRVMDALGFGLEQFDHVGRFRRDDDPAVADATGELPGGRRFSGAMELTDVLATTERRRFAETAVRRLMAFAIGRELRPADRCFVEAILDQCEPNDYRLQDLIEAVINSPPHTYFSVPVSEGLPRDA